MSAELSPLRQAIGKFDPKAAALLIIDMQRYFLSKDHPFGSFITAMNPEGAEYYYRRVEELVLPNTRRGALAIPGVRNR